MNPVIGIDLDDVLWDTLTAWLDRYNEVTDDDVSTFDVKSWDIAQYIKKGNRDILFYVLEQDDFWETVKPKPKSQEYLKQLIDDGYDIYIVTASYYKNLRKKMERFFELYPFLNFSNVIITSTKQMIDLDLLIDDNPENLCDGSYRKILFDAPHNQWCNEKNIGAVRFNSWEDIYKFIKEELPIEKNYIGR